MFQDINYEVSQGLFVFNLLIRFLCKNKATLIGGKHKGRELQVSFFSHCRVQLFPHLVCCIKHRNDYRCCFFFLLLTMNKVSLQPRQQRKYFLCSSIHPVSSACSEVGSLGQQLEQGHLFLQPLLPALLRLFQDISKPAEGHSLSSKS